MNFDVILLKYGEIALKGLNKPSFEAKLIKNIKDKLEKFGDFKVTKSQSTIYVRAANDTNLRLAIKPLKKVFGIANICPAKSCEKNMDAIKFTALQCVKEDFNSGKVKTFKVEAKREDKNFPLNSMEISREVGGFILKNMPEIKVDVHNPDVVVDVEIRDNCYVHTSKIDGAGGIPVGASGRAMVLLSGGIDSPVSGFMMAKRGVSISAIHFHSYPYTSERAKDKVVDLAAKMREYCGNFKLFVVPFTEVQLAIINNFRKEYLTIMIRRFMMKIAERVAIKNGCAALVTGESIGQVASQTMESLVVTNECVDMPIFRPLICFDKEEICQIARKIDTFETSILPYEDCCTIFVPKHPTTRPKPAEVKKMESEIFAKVDFEKLINEAIENIETY